MSLNLTKVEKANSETRFEALFLAHYDAVFRLLFSIVGTREEAEDLAQEAFLRLHRAPDLWGKSSAASGLPGVRGWLYRVASNLAFNTLRGQARRSSREEAAYWRDGDRSAGGDPFDEAVRTDQRSLVRRVLVDLPERQAQMLMLRYAGLSYRELAEALDVAPSSVGTLLARAEAAFAAAYRGVAGDDAG